MQEVKRDIKFHVGRWGFLLVWGWAGWVPLAQAFVTALPDSLAPDTLSETVPTAFAPTDEIETDDFVLRWSGTPPAGVQARILPGSLQWVRVADVLVLPRGRLELQVPAGATGRVTHAGFSQAIPSELPVALISGERNPTEVVLVRAPGAKPEAATLFIEFKPRKPLSQRIFYDASCSRFRVRGEGTAQSVSGTGWGYVGCRFVESETTGHKVGSLEALLYWDGIGQSLRVGGAETPSSSVSVWPLRLRPQPGEIALSAGASAGPADLKLSYALAPVYHRGFVGAGLGPYQTRFEAGGGDDFHGVAPLVTVYGSFFITETMRINAFGASLIEGHGNTDFGLYLNTEYVRIFDRRLAINLLLGAHFISFSAQNNYYVRLGAPQGAEILVYDLFHKGHNLMLGGFFYPPIYGKSYYNIWARWGMPKFFVELNYISWGERTSADRAAQSSSFGLSFGMPVARFF